MATETLIDRPAPAPAPTTPTDPPVRHLADLPGPRGLPLLGNALQIEPDRLHQQLEAWALQFGPVYQVRFGRWRTLVVSDHRVVAATMRDRPDGFRRTARLQQVGLEMGLKPGVFGANGEEWKRQRRMVMHGFDPTHVRRYFPALQGVAQRLAGRWQRAAQGGQAIDLQADLMRYTVDTIAGLAFGVEVNTLESDHDVIQQHLDKIFPTLSRRLVSPFPVWRWFKSKSDRQLEQSMVAVNAAVDGFVAQARARLLADPTLREQPRNLLEAMLVKADEPGSGIDDRQVAGNVMTMLLAGEDTTANTIAWMVWLLWRNPLALALATAEVRRVCGDTTTPTLAQIEQLEYVEACAHETMRLKPVAPLMPLQAERDTVVAGVLLPKGSVVIGLMRHDALQEQHLPQATAFLPQRWLGDGGPAQAATSATSAPAATSTTSVKRVSMPFGAGPRICPGRYLALLEMKMAMATLLGRFDIVEVTAPGGTEPREQLSFTMAPVGLRMRLRDRAAPGR